MVEPIRSRPFVSDENENFLWFCLTVKTSGIAGSKRLQIQDEMVAWDLDNAVAFRLLIFEREVAEQQAKLIAFEVSKIFGDGSGEGDTGDNDAGVERW